MTRVHRVVLLLLAVLLAAGCASVPGSSEVTVLRQVGDAAEPTAPPGPARDAGPLETVRGWVLASGATAERHRAARGFLTSATAGTWDDGASPVVVSDQVDTVFAKRIPLSAGTNLEVRAEIFNVFNRNNFANPVATLPNALGTGKNEVQPEQPYTTAAAGTFGRLTSTVGRTVGLGTNRQAQFAVRLNF